MSNGRSVAYFGKISCQKLQKTDILQYGTAVKLILALDQGWQIHIKQTLIPIPAPVAGSTNQSADLVITLRKATTH